MGEAPVEAAARQAAEVLLQDEGMASDLEDLQAEALLHWALSAAEKAIVSRRPRAQTLERAALAAAVRPVPWAARASGELAATHVRLAQGEILQRLLALTDTALQIGAAPSDIEGPTPTRGEPEAPTVPPEERGTPAVAGELATESVQAKTRGPRRRPGPACRLGRGRGRDRAPGDRHRLPSLIPVFPAPQGARLAGYPTRRRPIVRRGLLRRPKMAEPQVNVDGNLTGNHFAPKDHALEHVITAVQRAKKSVQLMAFSFTDQRFAQALIARAKA